MMRHTQEPFQEGGNWFVEWECPRSASGDCWHEGTIPAPEYNCLWYVLDAAELRELERAHPGAPWIAELRREHANAKRRFPSAWRRYRGG